MTVIDQAIADMPAKAATSVSTLIDALVARMIERPEFINMVVTGGMFWPPEKPLPVMLQWCRDSIDDEVWCARQGFYRRDAFTLEDIRAAEAALLVLIRRQVGSEASGAAHA